MLNVILFNKFIKSKQNWKLAENNYIDFNNLLYNKKQIKLRIKDLNVQLNSKNGSDFLSMYISKINEIPKDQNINLNKILKDTGISEETVHMIVFDAGSRKPSDFNTKIKISKDISGFDCDYYLKTITAEEFEIEISGKSMSLVKHHSIASTMRNEFKTLKISVDLKNKTFKHEPGMMQEII